MSLPSLATTLIHHLLMFFTATGCYFFLQPFLFFCVAFCSFIPLCLPFSLICQLLFFFYRLHHGLTLFFSSNLDPFFFLKSGVCIAYCFVSLYIYVCVFIYLLIALFVWILMCLYTSPLRRKKKVYEIFPKQIFFYTQKNRTSIISRKTIRYILFLRQDVSIVQWLNRMFFFFFFLF